MSSRPTGQQQRKPVSRKFATGVVEGPGVVDWQTWDAAEKRRRRLVGRGRPSTATPDRVHHDAELVHDLLRHVEPVQFGVQYPWQSSVELVCAGDHTSCSIHHSLKLVSRHFWRTRQKSVAVIDAWRHEWMDECRCWLRVEWTPTTPQLPKPIEAGGADDRDYSFDSCKHVFYRMLI